MLPLADGAYLVTDGVYTSMFVVTGSGVVYFDAPPSLIAGMNAAAANVTDAPVTHLVYSHAHVDHIGAAAEVASGGNVTIVAHRIATDALVATADPARPPPDVTIEGPDGSYSAGGLIIDFYPLPWSHDEATTLLHLPALRIAVLIDMVSPGGWAPFRCARARIITDED